MGIASAVVFANLGAAYGTAKSGVGLASMGIFHPDAVMRNIIPCVMAGVLGIYGLITAIILKGGVTPPAQAKAGKYGPSQLECNASDKICMYSTYSAFDGYKHLCAGLVAGLSCLAAGMAIGIAGDAGVRAVGQVKELFVSSVLILIFSEALALYGLIVGLVVGLGANPCQFALGN